MTDIPQVSEHCDPQTIWALDEPERISTVRELTKACAQSFRDAAHKNDAAAAQDYAIAALSTMAGLFPPEAGNEGNEAANIMLHSLIGMIAGAKGGRTDHLLLQSTRPITTGTKRGSGHALVGAFAISAVNLLTDKGMSAKKAREEVAKVLAESGMSLRSGDHGQPTPITASAIRNWCDKPEDYPLQHANAERMAETHASNLAGRQASTQDGVLAYLRDMAPQIVRDSRAL